VIRALRESLHEQCGSLFAHGAVDLHGVNHCQKLTTVLGDCPQQSEMNEPIDVPVMVNEYHPSIIGNSIHSDGSTDKTSERQQQTRVLRVYFSIYQSIFEREGGSLSIQHCVEGVEKMLGGSG
jgi:hypothetical protein